MCVESHGEIILTGETKELGENPVPVLLCPPQIPHTLARERTRASAVRDRRLTTSTMAQPRPTTFYCYTIFHYVDPLLLQIFGVVK
jgi:hypothetical protein